MVLINPTYYISYRTNYLFYLHPQKMSKKTKEPVTTFNYDFKNWTVKKAFKQYALDNGMTLQEMITVALKSKFSKIKQ